MSLLSVCLAAAYRVLGLVGPLYQSPPGQLSYDFASWRRLLIRDNQLSIGIVVNVVFLGLAFRNHSETNKKGNQSRLDAFHT